MDATLKPLVFGYVALPQRTNDYATDLEADRWHRQIRTFAHEEGYALAGMFSDVRQHGEHGFYAMAEQLRHGDAVAVVVPDLDHLASLGCLAGADERTASRYLQARILAVHETTKTKTPV